MACHLTRLRAAPRPRRRVLQTHMLEFRILGPLEVWDGEKTLELGGQRQRAVLAVLAMHVGEVVPSERLITYLWGESPPPTAATSLQNAVSQLRKALGADVVETRAPGYALNAEKDAVDARRFERLVNEARSRRPSAGSALMREALQLWRGPPLGDFPYEQFAQNEAARLEELRLTAVEERSRRSWSSGGAAELVGELEALVRENPLRERPRGQLMLALYRSGRQAEALQAYQDARRMLVDELGIEPTPALQQLHASILRQESALQPQAVPGAGEDQLGEVVRALLSGRLVHVLGPGPSSENGESPREPPRRGFRLPRGASWRPDEGLAVRRGHPGRRPAVRPAARPLRRGGRAGAGRALPREPCPSMARARGDEHQLLVTTAYGQCARARVRGARRGGGRRLVRRPRPEPREVPAPSAGRVGDGRRRPERVRGSCRWRSAR